MANNLTLQDLESLKFNDRASTRPAVRVFNLGLLEDVAYDYVAVGYPTSSSEVYTFKTGGSSGTTVRVITITYTDSTKADLSSVARTS